MRLRGAPGWRVAIENAGGRQLFQQNMSVNGTPATVTVFGHDANIRRVRHALGSALEIPTEDDTDGLLATVQRGNTNLTLILLPSSPSQTIGILIETKAEDRPTTGVPPAPPDRDWPRAPGEQMRFSARSHDSGTAFSYSETAAAPQTVQTEIALQLQAAGWLPILEGDPSGGLALFARENHVCAVLALADDSGTTQIAILRRMQNPF